jgi:hypothetical protein
MNRDFKGVWIPKEIWLSENLTLQEKVFLVEISSLDNDEGCFANNNYFAEFFGLSKTRVSLIIKSLVEKGYITSDIIYKEGTKQILKRVLKVCYIPYLRNVKEGSLRNVKYPPQEKLKDNNIYNNTSINNTINNNKNTSSSDDDFDIFWDKYNKKVDRKKCLSKWKRLTKKDKNDILNIIDKYIKAHPDIKFRKNPLTFLNGEVWKDEIVDIQETTKDGEYKTRRIFIGYDMQGKAKYKLEKYKV